MERYFCRNHKGNYEVRKVPPSFIGEGLELRIACRFGASGFQVSGTPAANLTLNPKP